MKTQKVTIVPKPMVSINNRLGDLIQLMEMYEFTMTSCTPPTKLKLSEIRDMYDLIGIEMTEEDINDWYLDDDGRTEYPVFTFTFEKDMAHSVIDLIEPHKQFPLMYVKIADK